MTIHWDAIAEFDGDMSAYWHHKRFGVKTAFSWSDLETASKINSEYWDTALEAISHDLGYLPDHHVFIPHIANIQTLLNNCARGIIGKDLLLKEVFHHIQNVRNDDMKKGGWLKDLVYGDAYYENYKTLHSEFKDAARSRLCKFLQYEPDLNYSIAAEINLRKMYLDKSVNISEWNKWDYKLGTVVNYRKSFIQNGETTANAMGFLK